MCKEIGCKIVGEQKLNPITNINVKKTSPVVLGLGQKEFKLDSLDLDDSSVLRFFHVDGIIGGDILLKNELIVNLASEYLCIPKEPVYKIAEKMKMQKVEAVYDQGRIWTSFVANGKEIKDYFLDTGSDTTSFLKKDIGGLKLQKLGTETRCSFEHGFHNVDNYGPVSVTFAGNKKELKFVATASDSEMRKLGTDVLSSLIIGFDPESKYVFVGH